MLVIERKVGEGFAIHCPSGELIHIQILPANIDTRKGSRRIGIEAPPEYKVWRDEIDQTRDQNDGFARKNRKLRPEDLGEGAEQGKDATDGIGK